MDDRHYEKVVGTYVGGSFSRVEGLGGIGFGRYEDWVQGAREVDRVV